MKIKGLVESSFLDWDGKLVTVAFVGGCNFRCSYCHAQDLLSPDGLPDIPFQTLEDLVTKHAGWLDGIVVSGGEPTIHPDLPHFLSKLKTLGLPVKLDTNGSNPEMIRHILEEELVDYVAMDVKAPLTSIGDGGDKSYYDCVAGLAVDIKSIKKTIKLLIESSVEHEFRTTVSPPLLSRDDVTAIARDLRGAKRYVLQQFNLAHAVDFPLRNVRLYDRDELLEMASICRKYVATCIVRGEQPSIACLASPQDALQPAIGSTILAHGPEAAAAAR